MGSRKESESLRKVVIEAIETYFKDNSDLIANIADMVVVKVKGEIEAAVNDKVVPIIEENKKLIHKVNSLEQVNKKNNIRIFGLSEARQENLDQKVVDFFSSRLNVNISADKVVCYRNNIKTSAKSKPVTVKFLNHADKRLVISNRKKLKGSKMFLCDDLTTFNHNLLKTTQQLVGKSNAWTIDGRIYAICNGEKHWIASNDVLRGLKNPCIETVGQSSGSLTDGATKNKPRSNSVSQKHNRPK